MALVEQLHASTRIAIASKVRLIKRKDSQVMTK